MKIHTFGDSHAYYGWKDILPNGFQRVLFNTKRLFNPKKFIGIETHHLGPILCYTFGKDVFDRCDISQRKHKVKDGDIVIFSFGEIDCRCHINKYDFGSYKALIENIILKYYEAIEKNIKKCKAKIHTVCVYNIPPPAVNKESNENPNFPFVGDDLTRKKYHKYFNNKLLEYSQRYGYTFIDVYKEYSDKNGFLNERFSDGIIHIDNPLFIKKFLNRELNLEMII